MEQQIMLLSKYMACL